MFPISSILDWNQIKHGYIPEKSGIYAWYYRHGLGLGDINNLKDQLRAKINKSEKRILVESFIREFIFEKFDEEPYSAKIEGALKPSYQGLLHHTLKISNDLIDDIVKDVDLLDKINIELKQVDISFSSPLYIGMAKNLLSRILQHKEKIEKIKPMIDQKNNFLDDLDDSSNFALRFTKRKLRSDKLYVAFKEIDSDVSMHNKMEYILNRINYPLLGRN